MDLEITIRFLDYWHCGSGESGGSASDATVVRYTQGDLKDLPYVPGKTLKGHIREMVEANQTVSCQTIQTWFGNTTDDKSRCYDKDKGEETQTHISNANLVEGIAEENIPYLFKVFKNTKLKDGIADDSSLREIETVIPVTLKAVLSGVKASDTEKTALKNAIKSIKRIGLNRNRGMGRCEVEVVEIGGVS